MEFVLEQNFQKKEPMQLTWPFHELFLEVFKNGVVHFLVVGGSLCKKEKKNPTRDSLIFLMHFVFICGMIEKEVSNFTIKK